MSTDEQKAEVAQKLWDLGNLVAGYGTIQSVALLYVLLDPDQAPKIQRAAYVVVAGVALVGLLLGAAIARVGGHERRLRAELGADSSTVRTVRALVFGRIAIVAIAHAVVVGAVLLHAKCGGLAECR